jgi:hypothetical protein
LSSAIRNAARWLPAPDHGSDPHIPSDAGASTQSRGTSALKDICGATDRETEAVVRWMMDALVDAALLEGK